MKYLQIKFPTTSQYAEQLSDALWEIGAISTSFEDCEDVPIFEPELNQTVLWEHTKVVSLFNEEVTPEEVFAALAESLDQTLIPASQDCEIEILEDQDWTRAWMDQFKPMCFGEKLWICPTNQELDPTDKIIVHLDPGLAFGTGTHPTTRMCLQWLDKLASEGKLQGKTVLDYGCGSGILAIAALKLGAKQAIGVDIDPQAIEASLNNAQANQVSDKLHTYLVKDFPQDTLCDILVANILAGPLVELAPTLAKYQQSGELLAVSGIIDTQEKAIQNAYQDFYHLEAPKHDEEWLMFAGVRK